MAKDTKMKTIEERIYQKLIENGYLSEPRLPLEAVSTEECIEMMRELVTEQKAIDIDLIPQLYVRWLMIEGEKPSWEDYALRYMEEK